MKPATAPFEAKAHGAWLGAGSGVALAQIIVGVVQAVTRRPLDPGFIAAIDGVTSPLLALLGAWLAPHTPRLPVTPAVISVAPVPPRKWPGQEGATPATASGPVSPQPAPASNPPLTTMPPTASQSVAQPAPPPEGTAP